MCGGTYSILDPQGVALGLSPRVRGNHRSVRTRRQASRSIPACAGEPRRRCSGWRCRRVYPRVCGGTSPSGLTRRTICGLSPRVRGNRLFIRPFINQRGSIPACAGEPSIGLGRRDDGRVYPRVCGGTPYQIGCYWIPLGLSPRVRGNPDSGRYGWLVSRSIPACAGEPLCYYSHVAFTAFSGLSPRVRGNPPISPLPRTITRVYPRVCGGTKRKPLKDGKGRGLSPRVRGNPGTADAR